LYLNIWTEHLPNERFKTAKFDDKQLILGWTLSGQTPSAPTKEIIHALLTAKLPNAALAARCTSVSWLLNKKRIGSRVSRRTERTSFSVISAKARAALRWRSTLSENERVVNAERGEPVKKFVVVRSIIWLIGLLANAVGMEDVLSRY